MPDKPGTENQPGTRTGVTCIVENETDPDARHEQPPPSTLLEQPTDQMAITGPMPVFTEAEDDSAQRDQDPGHSD